MILTVENAILERLKRGLGKSINTVESYGGQFDGDGMSDLISVMPALFVDFAGHQNPKAKSTSNEVLNMPATFVVYVVTRNVASEKAGRSGTKTELGAYRLIPAVRRLLANQDFGLRIEELKVGPVKKLASVKVGLQGLTVYGCSFDTRWIEKLREGQGFPFKDDPVFAGLYGERADDVDDLLRVGVKSDLGADGSIDAVDVVNLRERL